MWVNKLTIFSVITIFFMIAAYNPASAKEIIVDNNDSGADFLSIQEAVNNSSSGDVILIYPGFYNESVDIGVQNISILSESENPKDTAVRAFKPYVNNITISGFSIRENLALQGRRMDELWCSKIENCTVKNNTLESGIYADQCCNSTIEKNVILSYGISVSGSDGSLTISDNLLVDGGIDSHVGQNIDFLNNLSLTV